MDWNWRKDEYIKEIFPNSKKGISIPKVFLGLMQSKSQKVFKYW